MAAGPAHWRQKDYKFKASLRYEVSLCSPHPNNKGWMYN